MHLGVCFPSSVCVQATLWPLAAASAHVKGNSAVEGLPRLIKAATGA